MKKSFFFVVVVLFFIWKVVAGSADHCKRILIVLLFDFWVQAKKVNAILYFNFVNKKFIQVPCSQFLSSVCIGCKFATALPQPKTREMY